MHKEPTTFVRVLAIISHVMRKEWAPHGPRHTGLGRDSPVRRTFKRRLDTLQCRRCLRSPVPELPPYASSCPASYRLTT